MENKHTPKFEPRKAGFAVMIGRSNVGKSTLLNGLVGSKVAITTPKAQTTRRPIQGILTDEQGQIVFLDTPGVMQKSNDLLTKKLLNFVLDSLKEVDVLLYVVDPTRSIGNEEKQVMHLIEHLKIPKILVINKIDERKKPYLEAYQDMADRFDDVVQVSALKGHNLNYLKQAIFEKMPFGEYYYPEYQFTSLANDLWLAELIREKLFLRLRKEVPYSVHVEVNEVSERPNNMMYIAARILTNERRYKQMIIGSGGRGIKEIGQSVRKELEAVSNKKIYLDLEVDYDPHWIERI